MKIGIGLPNQIHDVQPSVIPQWSARAESAGFSSLSTVGRIMYPGVMDTAALAAAAGATSTIQLTSTIMITTIWPPVLLAKELAAIDTISGGRLTLGIGIGGNRPEDFVVDGLPSKGLGKRIDHDLEVYRSVWRGELIGDGIYPAVSPGTREIPMLFGGTAPPAYKRMATWGEGYIAGSMPAPMIAPMFDSARDAWKQAGRPNAPKLVAVAYFAFGDRARANIGHYYTANGPELSEMMAKAVNVGRNAIRTTIDSFTEIGCDELIFLPGLPDPDEISKLADAAL